jgi:hypothetical protein
MAWNQQKEEETRKPSPGSPQKEHVPADIFISAIWSSEL